MNGVCDIIIIGCGLGGIGVLVETKILGLKKSCL